MDNNAILPDEVKSTYQLFTDLYPNLTEEDNEVYHTIVDAGTSSQSPELDDADEWSKDMESLLIPFSCYHDEKTALETPEAEECMRKDLGVAGEITADTPAVVELKDPEERVVGERNTPDTPRAEESEAAEDCEVEETTPDTHEVSEFKQYLLKRKESNS